MTFDGIYAEYLKYFNTSLSEYFNSLNADSPSLIKDAIRYAVMGGGKRLRPIICYSTTEMLGGKVCDVKQFALAIEFIHSYSLVHDDLPAMDNDDYRRGKLSTHKKFGEAYGVLCGDALLNLAFEVALSKVNFSNGDLKALKVLAEYSGYSGMIAGQVLDLQNEKNVNPDKKTLYSIYENKTAKLITAPLLVASCICGGKYFDELKEYGYNLGITFQIADDILDVDGNFELIGKTPHKDEVEDKLTSVKAFGYDGAKKIEREHYEKAKSIISRIPNSEFLTSLTDKIYLRKN